MRTIAELEKELWKQIKTATEGKNPDKLAQLGLLAQEMERKNTEWDAKFEAAMRGGDGNGGAATVSVAESVPPRNGGGRRSDYTKVPIRGFEFEGTRVQCNTYKGLLVGLANLLRERHDQRFDRCVLQLGGRKRQYFSRNADALKFAQQLKGGGLFAETNLNANLIVKICYDMVQELGHPETQLKIECGRFFDPRAIR